MGSIEGRGFQPSTRRPSSSKVGLRVREALHTKPEALNPELLGSSCSQGYSKVWIAVPALLRGDVKKRLFALALRA